jgi:predicted RNA binding protein YcfA (HicA-like mRNA interferase family)
MPGLTPCKRREFIRKLRALHYAGPYSGGNHSFMEKTPTVTVAAAAQTIRVPNTDIDDVGLLKRILRNAGIPDDVFINA